MHTTTPASDPGRLLIYGSTGFVGRAIAAAAVQRGMRPILAGRNARTVEAQATGLGVEHRAFALDEPTTVRRALEGVAVVLHCAGPFIHTYGPMVEACLASGAHYLDLTGEPRVYEAVAQLDDEARRRGVTLLPGVGFDVSATDCLAVHLKRRLPSATHLALAFALRGPASLPPGTANTLVEVIPSGLALHRNEGRLRAAPRSLRTRNIDFGRGPVRADLLTWGDCVMAFHSTGIPNIATYASLPPILATQLRLVGRVERLFAFAMVRKIARSMIPTGSTADQRARSSASVWGEVRDGAGRTAVSRLTGPEGGVVWTTESALAAVRRVLTGEARPGFHTVGTAFGPDFVLECAGVTRTDA